MGCGQNPGARGGASGAGRPLSDGGGLPESSIFCGAVKGTSHHETDDNYRGEMLRLGRFHIAVCRDGIQWLFQRQRTANAGGGPAFDTLGFWPGRATG